MSKRDWAHKRQTQAHSNLFSIVSISIPAVTTLRSSSRIYVFVVYNIFFFSLLILSTAHRRLLSEYPSYIPRQQRHRILKHSRCWHTGIFRISKTCNYHFGVYGNMCHPLAITSETKLRTCYTNITDSHTASLPRQFKWAQNYDGHMSQVPDVLK
jgi:hypothetical protein